MGSQSEKPAADVKLKRLFWLRNVSIAGQALAVLVAHGVFGIDLPLPALVSTIGVLGLVNAATWWRLRQPRMVLHVEIFCQLVADVVLLALALYLSGGATNPFVTLFLLPITVAATVLPVRYCWAMVVLASAAYSILMFWYQPLGYGQHLHSEEFGLHVLGMWLNFIASAMLVAFFISRLTASLRDRERELAAARERELRDEQLVTLGMFATGAAHELGTPLSAIAVLAKELEQGARGNTGATEDFKTLRGQVEVCKRILTDLVGRAGRARAESARVLTLPRLVDESVARWQLLRPGARLRVRYAGDDAPPLVAAEETVIQALVSLINNAADASPEEVTLECNWSEHGISLEICDRGPGFPERARTLAGKEAFSEKAGLGLGLGLLLASATIEKLGGRILLTNRQEGGATTRIELPIAVAMPG